MNPADVFKAEIVKSEFKVNQRVIVVQAVNEHAANVFIQFVVAEVQTQQGCIGLQRLDHLLHAQVFLTVMRQIVGLQVEETQCLVLFESNCEDSCGLQTKTVAFELELAECLVVEEQPGNILAFLVANLFAAQVQRLERFVVCDDLGEDDAASSAELHARYSIIDRCIVLLGLLQENKHAATELLIFFLLHLLLSPGFVSSAISLLLRLLFLVLLLLAVTLFFLLLVSQLYTVSKNRC